MESVLKCPICKDQLEHPVFLPCGCTVCKNHADCESSTIKCPKCLVVHDIPQKGFVINSMAVYLLEIGSSKENDEKKVTFESFEYLKDLFGKLKCFGNRVIDDLKNLFNLRKEEAKIKIENQEIQANEELDEVQNLRSESNRLKQRLFSNDIDYYLNKQKLSYEEMHEPIL